MSAPLNRVCMQTSTIRTLSHHLLDKLGCGLWADGLNPSKLKQTRCHFYHSGETKELAICRNAAIKAQFGSLICRLYGAGLTIKDCACLAIFQRPLHSEYAGAAVRSESHKLHHTFFLSIFA